MHSTEVEITNILGVGKNGTTLLGSLLDNHPEISTFPLEMKFVEHYFNSINDKTFSGVTDYFLNKSKISLLNDQNIKNDPKARMIIGNIYTPKFNVEIFKDIVRKNIDSSLKGEKDFKTFIVFLHKCLNIYLQKEIGKKIVIQDGVFGLRYIEAQKKLFGKIKFIIVVRNPLDVYVSLKNITHKFKIFRRNIHDLAQAENLNTSQENLNYCILNKVFRKYHMNENFLFLRYEDLVNNPETIMKKIADFLDVSFNKNLMSPSIFGEPWFGNSSRVKEKKGIDNKEVDKYKNSLNSDEIHYITCFNQKFFKNFNYQKHIKKFKFFQIITLILKIYLQNIIEVKSSIKNDGAFLMKYIYFILVLNNKFLLKSLKSFVLK